MLSEKIAHMRDEIDFYLREFDSADRLMPAAIRQLDALARDVAALEATVVPETARAYGRGNVVRLTGRVRETVR